MTAKSSSPPRKGRVLQSPAFPKDNSTVLLSPTPRERRTHKKVRVFLPSVFSPHHERKPSFFPICSSGCLSRLFPYNIVGDLRTANVLSFFLSLFFSPFFRTGTQRDPPPFSGSGPTFPPIGNLGNGSRPGSPLFNMIGSFHSSPSYGGNHGRGPRDHLTLSHTRSSAPPFPPPNHP